VDAETGKAGQGVEKRLPRHDNDNGVQRSSPFPDLGDLDLTTFTATTCAASPKSRDLSPLSLT